MFKIDNNKYLVLIIKLKTKNKLKYLKSFLKLKINKSLNN